MVESMGRVDKGEGWGPRSIPQPGRWRGRGLAEGCASWGLLRGGPGAGGLGTCSWTARPRASAMLPPGSW